MFKSAISGLPDVYTIVAFTSCIGFTIGTCNNAKNNYKKQKNENVSYIIIDHVVVDSEYEAVIASIANNLWSNALRSVIWPVTIPASIITWWEKR